MARILMNANDELKAMMEDLEITAEELHRHMRCDVSLSLIQSWMCGRRLINKSSAETVWSVTRAIIDISEEKRGEDYTIAHYPIRDVLIRLCRTNFW